MKITQCKHTLRLFTSDPLSVVVVTSEVAVDSWVDGTVVVQYTVQSVRICTTPRWNGCSLHALMKTRHMAYTSNQYLAETTGY